MAELKALVFDVDGTLADTERDGHRVAFNRAFEAAGLDWHWSVERYGELLAVTGGKERIAHYLDHYRPDLEPSADRAQFIADLHREKTSHFMAALASGGIPLRPGIARLLDEARAEGLRLAIATTTTPENVEALIGHALPAGAMDWFDVIGAGDIVAAKKPAPDIYRWVLDALGLRAGDVVAFEDSAHGVCAARDAGIAQIVVTTNGYTEQQEFASATVVLDALGEPQDPARCVRGAPPALGYVDIAYLRGLVAARE